MTLFLEVKSKEGFVSRKTRIERPTASRALEEEAIGRTVADLGAGTLLAELGVRSPGWLRPVVQIRYRRHRFVDPLSQAPLSLDLSIRSRLLDPTLAVSPGWLELRNAVIEVKGTAMRPPATVLALRRVVPVWTSYSKSAQCLAGHLERPGSVPAGRHQVVFVYRPWLYLAAFALRALALVGAAAACAWLAMRTRHQKAVNL